MVFVKKREKKINIVSQALISSLAVAVISQDWIDLTFWGHPFAAEMSPHSYYCESWQSILYEVKFMVVLFKDKKRERHM